MRTLQDEVQKRGFVVAHIKTDSIKIPDATPEIIEFCMNFAKQYGYTFEHEATYERMCLVNNAVYIAKYATPEACEKLYGYVPGDCKKHGGEWTATGAQFAVPYVFKKLFSHEEIKFEDLCETKEVKKGALYLDLNESLPDVSQYEKELEKLSYRKFQDGTKEKIDWSKEPKPDRVVELENLIVEGHDYQFIGRIGLFCPIKPGRGGGLLVVNRDGKYSSAAGASGYRWLESELVRNSGSEDAIDRSYYDKLVDDAVTAINEYGDFEWFVSDDPYVPDTTPPWFNPDEPFIDEVDTSLFDVR